MICITYTNRHGHKFDWPRFHNAAVARRFLIALRANGAKWIHINIE